MNQVFSKIWIPIILIILFAGGILAWQYLKISEEKTTKWKEYKFEEISRDSQSSDFYDRRLIGIQDNGQRDVIVSSMKELIGWEEIGFYPREVSFPPYSSKIFFVKHRAETAHSAGFFMLNATTLESKELTEVGPIYENYYNYFSLISPDGFKIASYGNNDLYLLDLLRDKAILLAKAQVGETFYLAAETPEFQWLNDDTIQYPVHSAQDIYAPPIEIRRISIKTKEVKKVVKDETTDWKTYKNEEYRFEIKYPLDYMHQENTFTPRVNIVYFFPLENKSEFGFEPEIFISVDREPRGPFFHGTFGTVSRTDALNATGTQLISSKDIIINDIAWKKENWRLFNGLTPVIFYTKHGNDYYSISLGLKEKEKILNQILSTFKFLD